MKTIQVLTRLLLISSIVNWLSAGCSRETDKGLNPQADCHIQRTAITYHSQGADGSTQTDYTYDAQGNLRNRTKVTQSAIPNISSDKTTTTDSYEYDAAGYLARSITDVHQQYAFLSKASEYHYVSTATYAYTNERLSSLIRTDVTFNSSVTSGPQQQTSVSALAYIYDSAGQLQQINGQGGSSVSYQNGKEQSSSRVGSDRYELQDGLLVKATFLGTDASGASRTLVQVNQYDPQRRLIKHEEYINNQLDSYYTQEWQAGQPAEFNLPAFKGHPVILAPYGEQGLLLRYRAYSVNKQQQMVQYNEQTFEHQLNAKGFVTSTKQSSQILTNGTQPPDLTTVTYTYTGCN